MFIPCCLFCLRVSFFPSASCSGRCFNSIFRASGRLPPRALPELCSEPTHGSPTCWGCPRGSGCRGGVCNRRSSHQRSSFASRFQPFLPLLLPFTLWNVLGSPLGASRFFFSERLLFPAWPAPACPSQLRYCFFHGIFPYSPRIGLGVVRLLPWSAVLGPTKAFNMSPCGYSPVTKRADFEPCCLHSNPISAPHELNRPGQIIHAALLCLLPL